MILKYFFWIFFLTRYCEIDFFLPIWNKFVISKFTITPEEAFEKKKYTKKPNRKTLLRYFISHIPKSHAYVYALDLPELGVWPQLLCKLGRTHANTERIPSHQLSKVTSKYGVDQDLCCCPIGCWKQYQNIPVDLDLSKVHWPPGTFYHEAVANTGSRDVPHRSNPVAGLDSLTEVALRPKCSHHNTAPWLLPSPVFSTGRLSRQDTDSRWVICWAFLAPNITWCPGWHILKDIDSKPPSPIRILFVLTGIRGNPILHFCLCMCLLGLCSALLRAGNGGVEPWQAHVYPVTPDKTEYVFMWVWGESHHCEMYI